MHKLLIAMIAIAALSMLAPISGTAEPTHPNEIGLYATPYADGATGTYEVGTEVTVYLVLTRPEADGVPLSGISYFECQLNFDPVGGLVKTGETFNGDHLINVGNVNNLANGYLEYIVGWAADMPNVNEEILLISFRFIHLYPGVINVTLGPITSTSQSIPGQMAFLTPDHQSFEVMYSMGGSHDAPVFMFDGEAVPVETESFGSVKALYR